VISLLDQGKEPTEIVTKASRQDLRGGSRSHHARSPFALTF
jgi:hypothetical protein